MWHCSEGTGWWMMFGGIWMVLFWGAIIALVVCDIRKLTEHGGSGLATERRDPLGIAKERYAKSEISREESEQNKKDLSQM